MRRVVKKKKKKKAANKKKEKKNKVINPNFIFNKKRKLEYFKKLNEKY
jgi:hypothetical protein